MGKEDIVPVRDAVDRVPPEDGQRRLMQLVAEMSSLPGEFIYGPEEEGPVVGRLVGMTCYTETGLVYLSGQMQGPPQERAVTNRELRSIIRQFDLMEDPTSAIKKAKQWGQEGHEVLAGVLVGTRRNTQSEVVAFFSAPVLEPEEAMHLLRYSALSGEDEDTSNSDM
jgi:hypothetical protein